MKRFHFQLEKILRYHQQRQKQAELMVARAGRERATAQETVQELERRIDITCQLSERVGQPIVPEYREQSLRHGQQLCESLDTAQKALAAADQRLREAQTQYTEVTQQVEALLHLRSQRWDEHHDQRERLQQIELDDVVMKQWSKRVVREVEENVVVALS